MWLRDHLEDWQKWEDNMKRVENVARINLAQGRGQ